MEITLNELEQAINYWRHLRPSTGEERALSPEVNVLAKHYALMICHRHNVLPLDALDRTSQELVRTWWQQRDHR